MAERENRRPFASAGGRESPFSAAAWRRPATARSFCVGRIIAVFGAALCGIPASVGADEPSDYEGLVAKRAPVLVTVKFVLKSQGGFGDSEQENEITAIMIDAGGLVLCSNTALAGPRFLQRFSRATPTHIKVLVGDDTEGLDGELVTRDSELDLAWVRIKEPGDRKFTHLDLSQASKPQIGQRLLGLRRMGKYFGRAVVVSEGRLGGRAAKPRNLYVPVGGLDVSVGLPVFTVDGEVLGVVVVQMPEHGELEANPRSFMDAGRDMFGGLILPAGDVLEATRRAMEADEDDDDESDEEESDEEETATQPADKGPGD